MERHRRRHKQLVGDESGQSTVEYAVVLVAVLCVILALGALWRALESGMFVEHALASASHHVQASVGWVVDVFAY